MSCYHPLTLIYSPKRKKMVGCDSSDDVFICKTDDPEGKFVRGQVFEPVRVPCGQCVGCRLDQSREWANRCVMESLSYPSDQCWFLTLTYNDDNLPADGSVHKEDVQKFNKDLLRYYDYHYGYQGIRFYAGAEYGDQSGRPHYHVLYFGLPINDLKLYGHNHQGDLLYNSPSIEKIWSKGFVVIGQLTWQTAAYTARYVMKKRKGKDAQEYYDRLGIQPEFSLMSRRPGIGISYFNDHYEEIYQRDEIILPSVGKKLNSQRPPRIFDDHMKEIDLPLIEHIKRDRKERAILAHDMEINKTDLPEAEYFQIKEVAKQQQISVLRGIL